ncbi:pentatricopeptide repeat-containing protein At3g12770-like [Wolffia australiana]
MNSATTTLSRPLLCNSISTFPSISYGLTDQYFASLIDSSSAPSQILQTHANLTTSGLLRRGFLLTKLIHACSHLGLVGHGGQLFEAHDCPDIFLFNAAIKLYSQRNPRQALRHGFSSDAFIQNGLLAAYSKLAQMKIARRVFDQLPDRNRDVVSWTCIVSGYVQSGRPGNGLELFAMMLASACPVAPDFVMLVSVLKACAELGELRNGEALHGLAVKRGLEQEEDLQVGLIAFYAQCGELGRARAVFDLAGTSPALLHWNSIISGYAKKGEPREAVALFQKLTRHPRLRPDSVTVRAAIMAAARLGSLETAKRVGACAGELKGDVLVGTALVDMYSKCGSLELAREAFDHMPQRDVIAWSAIIAGHALHGRGREAIGLFQEMLLAGIVPNSVTFLGVLSACNHCGLVGEGAMVLATMRAHGMEPRRRHFACAVDMLGRAGRVAEACELMAVMPAESSAAAWGALLTACRVIGDVPTGALAAAEVAAMDPANVGHLVQLSNLLAGAGMWAEASRVRVMMKERGLAKASGSSIVDVDGSMQEFRCADHSHPASKDIYQLLYLLEMNSKEGEL